MKTLRTRAVDLDRDFNVVGQVAKTRVDEKTGERYITGLASGLAEDRDGERVSANAIRKMVAQPVDDLRLTSSHDQDWWSEIGDVTKHWHDAEHDELWVETRLPREGVDPMADKAWIEAQKRPLGFSIGGKLRKAFRELVNENGVTKQRKVLDEIWLRHYCLTAKPAYAGSFAEAVAKTFDAPDAPEEEFLEDGVVFDRTDEIRKAAKDDREAGDPTDDEPGESDPPAGSGDEKAPSDDGDGDGDATGKDSDAKADQEAADALPMAKRHLACPHCGHEFAAPLSADESGNRQPDEDAPDTDAAETKKTASTPSNEPSEDMPNTTDLSGALERVRALADVAKTTTDEPTPDAGATTETTGDLAVVAKAVTALEAGTAEAITGLIDVVKTLQEQVAALPQGRKSTAVAPDGLANARHDTTAADGSVEKTYESADSVRKAIADATTPIEALTITNEATRRGIQL